MLSFVELFLQIIALVFEESKFGGELHTFLILFDLPVNVLVLLLGHTELIAHLIHHMEEYFQKLFLLLAAIFDVEVS